MLLQHQEDFKLVNITILATCTCVYNNIHYFHVFNYNLDKLLMQFVHTS